MKYPYHSTLPGPGDFGPPEDDDMDELDYEPDDFGNEDDESDGSA